MLAAMLLLAALSGRDLFEAHCAGCHGLKGDGGKGTSLAQPRLPRAVDDEALKRIIRLGIPGTEMPFTRMTDVELDGVVAYVRELGRVAADVSKGDATRGAVIYKQNGCDACHAIRGGGGVSGPDLTDIGLRRNARHLRESVLRPAAAVPDNFTVYRKVTVIPDNYLLVRAVAADGSVIEGARVNEDTFSIQLRAGARIVSLEKSSLKQLDKLWGKTIMPSYEGKLSAGQLDDLIAYMATLKGDPQ